MKVNQLRRYGFKKVGEWKPNKKLNSGIKVVLKKFKEERALYAFVVGNDVKYIGVCQKDNGKEVTTLEDRMKRYQNRTGGSTNKRVTNKIKKCLKDSAKVWIFALKPPKNLKYKRLVIDLIMGLENPLIKRLGKGRWNKT